MNARADMLLEPIGRTASIIEIGPSINPIAPKAKGWNAKTIDVATKSQLIEKYKDQQGVDLNNIEEVDFLWRDGPLCTAVPPELHGTFDAFIASHDGKFTYWYIRPSQLDPGITPLFPVPNHPSYPANHATFSTARSEILAYLFPTRADFIRAVGKEGGDSRIWAGIHYPMDLAAGTQLGKSVAQLFIARAQADGSQ